MRSGKIDFTGIGDILSRIVIPQGEYDMEIMEVDPKVSRNGDPLVSVKLIPLDEEQRKLYHVWDNILIPSKDSQASKILWRAKRFLKCIAQPNEGEVQWDCDNWINKICKVKIIHEDPNQYHKHVKAIIQEYIYDENMYQKNNKKNVSAQEQDVPF